MLVWVQKMDLYEQWGGGQTESPIPERESPAVMAGLIRVYVIVNNYRTNFDDFIESYLFGIQVYGWNYRLLERIERDGIMSGIGLAGEGGDADAVLIRYLHLHGRNAVMVAGDAPFGPERVPLPCRYMIVDGRIDCESDVFALIHQRGEHQVGESEDSTALADAARVEVFCCHIQNRSGSTRGNVDEPDSAAGCETVTCVEEIFECHSVV